MVTGPSCPEAGGVLYCYYLLPRHILIAQYTVLYHFVSRHFITKYFNIPTKAPQESSRLFSLSHPPPNLLYLLLMPNRVTRVCYCLQIGQILKTYLIHTSLSVPCIKITYSISTHTHTHTSARSVLSFCPECCDPVSTYTAACPFPERWEQHDEWIQCTRRRPDA